MKKQDLTKDESVPRALRYALPVFIACDIGLLLAAHLCIGAKTLVDGQAPFGALKPHVASEDNLISGVGRLASTGAWLMVFVVAILSGIWPYLKLLSTLASVQLVNHGKITRERGVFLLGVFEALGKWSFADVFLICLNLVIFNIHTPVKNVAGLGKLEIVIWMQLQFGALALIIAISVSTILTQWAQQHLREPAPRWNSSSGEEDSQPLLGDSERPSAKLGKPSVNLTVKITMVTMVGIVLLIVGACVPFVQVHRKGFLGLAMDMKEPKSTLNLSVFNMLWQMHLHADASGGYEPMVCFFQIVFIIITFLAPLFEQLLLALAAIVSHASEAAAYWSITAAKWLHSFDCLEVFLLVGIIVVHDLATVIKFNLGSECDNFEPLLNNDLILGILGLRSAKGQGCFSTTSHLQAGWWLLASSVVVRFGLWRVTNHWSSIKEAGPSAHKDTEKAHKATA